MKREDFETSVKRLLSQQRVAVLGTKGETNPHLTLVAFTIGESIGRIHFVTPRNTRKYNNIRRDAHVTLLIDNRGGKAADFHHAEVLTVLGAASEITDEERTKELQNFTDKHPAIRTFARSPSCALMRVDVERVSLVSRFQEVTEADIDDLI